MRLGNTMMGYWYQVIIHEPLKINIFSGLFFVY